MKKPAGQSKTTRQSKAEQQIPLNLAHRFDKIYSGLLYLYAKRKIGRYLICRKREPSRLFPTSRKLC